MKPLGMGGEEGGQGRGGRGVSPSRAGLDLGLLPHPCSSQAHPRGFFCRIPPALCVWHPNLGCGWMREQGMLSRIIQQEIPNPGWLWGRGCPGTNHPNPKEEIFPSPDGICWAELGSIPSSFFPFRSSFGVFLVILIFFSFTRIEIEPGNKARIGADFPSGKEGGNVGPAGIEISPSHPPRGSTPSENSQQKSLNLWS